MTQKIYLSILFLLLCKFYCFSQSGVNFHASTSYWQHSDLVGYSIGFGTYAEVGKVPLSLNISYGYGEKNGLKNEDVDESLFHTIYVLDDGGLFGSPNTTDFAHQIMLELTGTFTLSKYKKGSFTTSGGFFLSRVSHFIISDIYKEYALNIPLVIEKEKVNLEVISSQNFFSSGLVLELAYNRSFREKNVISVFTSGKLGPNKTNSIGLGVRLSGPF